MRTTSFLFSSKINAKSSECRSRHINCCKGAGYARCALGRPPGFSSPLLPTFGKFPINGKDNCRSRHSELYSTQWDNAPSGWGNRPSRSSRPMNRIQAAGRRPQSAGRRPLSSGHPLPPDATHPVRPLQYPGVAGLFTETGPARHGCADPSCQRTGQSETAIEFASYNTLRKISRQYFFSGAGREKNI